MSTGIEIQGNILVGRGNVGGSISADLFNDIDLWVTFPSRPHIYILNTNGSSRIVTLPSIGSTINEADIGHSIVINNSGAQLLTINDNIGSQITVLSPNESVWLIATSISSGWTNISSVTKITTGTGLTGGVITKSGNITLDTSGVIAGSYTLASITVDSFGRITSASNNSVVTSLSNTSTGTQSLVNGGSTGSITVKKLTSGVGINLTSDVDQVNIICTSGLPTGGIQGDILVKSNSTDYQANWSAPYIKAIYNGTSLQSNNIIWYNINTSSGGLVVFTPTTDGTTGGTNLFSNLSNCSIQLTCKINSTSNTLASFAYVQTTSIDNKQVTCVVKAGNTGNILIGGTYTGLTNAPDGTIVQVTIIGQGT